MPSHRLIFPHVPKAGGSTLGRLLARNYGKSYYPYYGLWDRYMFTAEDVEGMCGIYPQYTCLASHLFSLHLPWTSPTLNVRAIVLVRDPVERALSAYFFDQQNALQQPGHAAPGPIGDYFEKVLRERDDPRFFNGQMTFLSRYDHASLPLERVEELHASGKVIVAQLEQFRTLCILAEQLPTLGLHDMAYASRANPSLWDQEVSDSLRAQLAQENALDLELHALAGRLLDRDLANAFPSRREFAEAQRDFDRRCRCQAGKDKQQRFRSRVARRLEHMLRV